MTPDEYVYIKMCKGMYSLPQVGLLAQVLLQKELNEKSFYQGIIIPDLWPCLTWLILFSLLVDNFGVKHTGSKHEQYLLDSLKGNYEEPVRQSLLP